MVEIKLNLTREQAEDVISTLCPLKYDENTGMQYIEIPEWMQVLRFFSKDADGLDRLIGHCLMDIRFANAKVF